MARSGVSSADALQAPRVAALCQRYVREEQRAREKERERKMAEQSPYSAAPTCGLSPPVPAIPCEPPLPPSYLIQVPSYLITLDCWH